ALLARLPTANLTDAGGAPGPDGAKVAISVASNVAIDPATNSYVQSAGGQLQSSGTTAGDGTLATSTSSYQVYTVAGGRVLASYSDVSLTAGVNETKVARVSVVGATTSGAISTSQAM